jgi:hypothetical protein
MPRLSRDLFYPADVCQHCGNGQLFNDRSDTAFFADASVGELARWQEHDELDQREPILIVLCERCADQLIEPHPRLYRRLRPNEPFPGAMPLCRDCVHRHEVRCEHPNAKANGGAGVELIFPKPTVAFIDGTRNGKKAGWREVWFPGPVQHCTARELPAHLVATPDPARSTTAEATS